MDPLRMMELGVDGTFKRRLKPDAAPIVPPLLLHPNAAQDTIWNF
jgi:hypothetical protein